MSIDKLKTKFFNGSFISDVKHYFTKINEIIDYLNNLVSYSPPYKVYTAILNQSSTNAPVPIILENTLGGTITWTRSLAGNYVGTLTGAFTEDKTVIFINGYNSTVSNIQYETIAVWGDADTIAVGTYKLTEQDSAGNLLKTALDGVLYIASIEIRVYN